MHPGDLRIEKYNYVLPENRIARHPLPERDKSKLLVRELDGSLRDSVFTELPELLGDLGLLIFNETRVVRARLIYPRGENLKPIELFCLDPANREIEQAMSATGEIDFQCMVGNAKRWKNQVLDWRDGSGNLLLQATPLSRKDGVFTVRFHWPGTFHFAAVLEKLGHVPLPPYMRREDSAEDVERYQCVYASRDGSVAAPTAGLHFTEDVLKRIEAHGVQLHRIVLHVGAGTFKPVSTSLIRDHDMHSEAFEVRIDLLRSLRDSNRRVVSVGTTSCRTLESLYWIGDMIRRGGSVDLQQAYLDQWHPYDQPSEAPLRENLSALIETLERENREAIRGRTRILIAPEYRFRVIHSLITNFHQPGSTLILLVAAALAGDWQKLYMHALNNDYRFLSYGDSTLLHIR